jgi:hypothetical protein
MNGNEWGVERVYNVMGGARRLLIRRRETRGRWKMFSHKWSRLRTCKEPMRSLWSIGRPTDVRWMDEWFTHEEGGKEKKKSQSIGRDVMAGVARCGGGVASSNDYRAWVSRTKPMMDEFKFNMGPHTRMRKMALKGFQPRSFLPFFSFETRHLRCILRSSALFTRFWGGIFGFLCAHNGRPAAALVGSFLTRYIHQVSS